MLIDEKSLLFQRRVSAIDAVVREGEQSRKSVAEIMEMVDTTVPGRGRKGKRSNECKRRGKRPA